ncbi:Mut7-C RNAse domain-containing protein [Noviherbaspirillum galbum]|uniref:Mut7-C ubiquitin/RNAse domain-containing protein n=1 Tax=Noviherbaspirillum galbum TaxID=2709383 RepID=A0A6B3SIF6_9BURK|nr:Mut7-C RNAse domain-containing protein [Noviherbaspirillum galbum]NEX60473.1 Mut7-C ubiquitin/RNAse domain-containing protein [Noviherbaspirillum galbum]
MVRASFRFFAELNDFLPPRERGQRVGHACPPDASVKHMIEALGVPHTEVQRILVNGAAAGFGHRLQDGDEVAIYPAAGAEEGAVLLRPPQPDPPRFIADAHLGQLAKYLRMLGFDVLYRNDYDDAEVARIAAADNRIVLSRDRDLLIRKEILHGCYLHAVDTDAQIAEVVARYRLAASARALTRCLGCNGLLRKVEKDKVEHRVPAHSRSAHERFFECEACLQVYWEGSHVARMRRRVAAMLGEEKS